MAAIFLHTSWRSAGTWLWTVLRADPRACGFYEPFHEQLATLTPQMVPGLRPDAWNSGHPAGRPYFEEYLPLLAPRGGVRGYDPAFAQDGFFAPPPLDPAIAAYLATLCHAGSAGGRVAVLKFCRSLGRVEALRQAFPEAVHLIVLRDPLAQFRSAARQWQRDGNWYFLLRPFLVLSRNQGVPLVRQICAALGVRLPAAVQRDLPRAEAWCWRHVLQLSWADRYRGLLAFWTATALAALQDGCPGLEADRLAEPSVRDAALAAFAAAGLHPHLQARPPSLQAATAAEAAALDLPAAHAAALAVLRSHALPPAAAALIRSMLLSAGPVCAGPGRAPPRPAPVFLEPWTWWVERRVNHHSGGRLCAVRDRGDRQSGGKEGLLF